MDQSNKIQEIGERQLGMEQTANKMALSLADAVNRVEEIQSRHDNIMSMRAKAIPEIHAQNLAMAAQSQKMADMAANHQQMITAEQNDRNVLLGQIKSLFQNQSARLDHAEDNQDAMRAHYQNMREQNPPPGKCALYGSANNVGAQS